MCIRCLKIVAGILFVYGGCFAQWHEDQLAAIGKYMYTQYLYKMEPPQTLKDYVNLNTHLSMLYASQDFMKKEIAWEKIQTFQDLTFYEFTTSILHTNNPLRYYVAIDKNGNVFHSDSTDILIEQAFFSTDTIDETVFSNMVNIYNTISFVDKHVMFFEKYDHKIFWSQIMYESYNKIMKEPYGYLLMKVYERKGNPLERWKISYTYREREHSFRVNELLIARIPREEK